MFINDEIMKRVGIEPPLTIEFGKELIKNGLNVDLANVKDTTSLAKEIIKTLKGGEHHE